MDPERAWRRENLEAISFLQRLNTEVFGPAGRPDLCGGVHLLAGVSRPIWLGGLGFGFKWDMGWMHDTLRTCSWIRCMPLPPQALTFRGLYAFHENFVLPSATTSRPRQGLLLNKMAGDDWQKRANLRLPLRQPVVAPRQEAALHGERVRPVARVGPRIQHGLALTSDRRRRKSSSSSRSQRRDAPGRRAATS